MLLMTMLIMIGISIGTSSDGGLLRSSSSIDSSSSSSGNTFEYIGASIPPDSFFDGNSNVLLSTTALVFVCGVLVLYYIIIPVIVWSNIINITKAKGQRPPLAPFGMFECIRFMTSEEQPWFPLRAKETMGGMTDTFILPLPRRPVVTGDATLAREILMDPLSIKPKTYQEFEPFGIGSIFTRNGSYWVRFLVLCFVGCFFVCKANSISHGSNLPITYILLLLTAVLLLFELHVTLNSTSIMNTKMMTARTKKRRRTKFFEPTREAHEPGSLGPDREMDQGKITQVDGIRSNF